MICQLQKASLIKRISAYLFDMIMMVVVVVGVASSLSLALGYSEQADKAYQFYDRYEEEYDIDFDITAEEQAKLSQETLDRYQAANAAMNQDQEMMKQFSVVMSLTLLIAAVAILFGYLLLELIMPMILKNGQSIGKRIFSIGVIREDGVRLRNVNLAMRTILGKFTIETMVPVLVIVMVLFGGMGLIGLLILAALLLTQIIMFCKTEASICIHDKVAKTVVVDLLNQTIFEDEEELRRYKEELRQEQANRPAYLDEYTEE